jgi:hypothetical protein
VRSLLSKQFLLDFAAYASLFLLIAILLFSKGADLVELIASRLRKWVLGFLDFVTEVRDRLERREDRGHEPFSRNPCSCPKSESTARITQDESHAA